MRKLLVIMSFLLVITGCAKQEETVSEISKHVEKAVVLEGNVQDEKKLLELETQEEELYKKVVALMSQGKEKEIKEQAQKALQIVKQRQELVTKKQENIAASLEEMTKAEKLVSSLKKKESKASGEEMIKVGEERLSNSKKMFDYYITALKHDESLYTFLVKGEFANDKIAKEVDALNENYSNVLKLKEEVNKQTETFNKKKADFFSEVGYEGEEKEKK
ncbi:MAG: YkyA family protein [Bacillaceae bacterium]